MPSDLRFLLGAPGRIRTCDARFRKPTLYPLSYEGGAWHKPSQKPTQFPKGLWPCSARIVERSRTHRAGRRMLRSLRRSDGRRRASG